MNTANAPPVMGRRFYYILDHGDGTADVILNPCSVPLATPVGASIVRDVDYTPELEADIRARFYAWCEAGEPIEPMKGEESMKNENIIPDNEPEAIDLEPEGQPEEPQTDSIFVLDGRGRTVRMEVPDDD